MSKRKRSLDSVIEELEEDEANIKIKENIENNNIENAVANKKIIGMIEQFYEKISVAAIKLNDSLDVGDIIEIGNDEEAVRQRVESIEINKKRVNHAEKGESVGIKLKWKVKKGDDVFKLL